ncbi:MAG TPA: nucleotide excision repair endonuclease [Pseudobdellovibrionaceae bacterium]|nr:nucleotide excision repair endonuclease [Pseudobdellovibrionaceae bacterium]
MERQPELSEPNLIGESADSNSESMGAEGETHGEEWPRGEQLRLFQIENPLKRRLDREFLRGIPRSPGVYWMLDEKGKLLYVGKGKDLKARLTSYRSAKVQDVSHRLMRLLFATAEIRFRETPNEKSALICENELLRLLKPPCNRVGTQTHKSASWIIREMPRSWRLELVFQLPELHSPTGLSDRDSEDRRHEVGAFRNVGRCLKVHGALMRQLFGLMWGDFQISKLPVSLLKGPSSMLGAFEDREVSESLAGPSEEDRRAFNSGLRELTWAYLSGIEKWPDFPFPSESEDRWSRQLWAQDQLELQQSFDSTFAPFRQRRVAWGLDDFAIPLAMQDDLRVLADEAEVQSEAELGHLSDDEGLRD